MNRTQLSAGGFTLIGLLAVFSSTALLIGVLSAMPLLAGKGNPNPEWNGGSNRNRSQIGYETLTGWGSCLNEFSFSGAH